MASGEHWRSFCPAEYGTISGEIPEAIGKLENLTLLGLTDHEFDEEEEEKLDDEEKASESVKEKSKVSEEHEERSDKYRKHPHNVTATQF